VGEGRLRFNLVVFPAAPAFAMPTAMSAAAAIAGRFRARKAPAPV